MGNSFIKRVISVVSLCLSCCLLLVACGGGDSSTLSDSQTKLLVSPGSVKISIPAANVTASSTDATNIPGNAVDNNLGTHWTGGAASGNQWIQFKLPSCYTADYANISWYNGDARQYGYTIEASADNGVTWTTVKTGTTSGTSAALVQVDFPDTAANMMRLSSSGSNVSTKVSINEVEFWGASVARCSSATTTTSTATTTSTVASTTTTTQASTSVKLSIPAANVTASSTDTTNIPGNAVDNSLTTHWTGGAASGNQWIQFSLGACYSVDFANLSWYNGDARQYSYTIEASADNGATWSTVSTGTSSGTSAALVKVDFTNKNANMMRVSSSGSNVSTKVSINEVEFWGASGGTCSGATTTTTTTTASQTSTTAAAGAPAIPGIEIQNYNHTSDFPIVWHIWSGNNATSWALIENGVQIQTGNVAATGGAQSVTMQIAGRVLGLYTYQVKVSNASGSALSAPSYTTVGNASLVGIKQWDTPGQALQQTVALGSSSVLDLSVAGVASPSFKVASNNPLVATATVSGTKLTVTAVAAGRAGIRVTDANNNVRFVGVRVKNADGSLPGIPNYLSLGTVSDDSTTSLATLQNFGSGALNTHVDFRYLYLNGGASVAGNTSWCT